MLQVIVGSTSPIKLEATREACRLVGLEAQIEGKPVASGVNREPVGNEITNGAFNRWRAAWAGTDPNAIVLGMENGLITVGNHWADMAMVVASFQHEIIYRRTRWIVVPNDVVAEVFRRGADKTTIGQVLHEQHPECLAHDPHSWLTGGKTSRHDLLVEALVEIFRALPGLCRGQ